MSSYQLEILADPVRLGELHRLALLDTAAEAAFDRLTALAAEALGAPVSLVSLVDDHRQFFKSIQGLGEPWTSLRETPLSHAFCRHVVATGQPLVVPDTRADERFVSNRAVTELGMAAYLGMPLVSSGHGIGSLCVIDRVPREWSERDLRILRGLAASVMTEIEVRHQARRRVAASEGRIVELLERINDGFVALDAEWRYVYVNAHAGRMFGREPASLVGKHIWTEFPEGVGQPFHLAYERAMREQVPVVLEEYYEPWNRWFENRIFPSPEGVSILFHEVTDRRLAERALRESEERFRALAENLGDVLFLLDPVSLAPIYVNQTYERLYEHPSSELMKDSMAWSRNVHEDDRGPLLASFARLREGEFADQEFRLRRSNGSLAWVRVRVFPVRDAKGQVLQVAGLSEDITERRRLGEALLHANAELERRVAERTAALQEANAELDAYSYSISHDLRAPLRSLRGFSQALLEDYGDSLHGEGRDYLDRIVRAAKLMDRLVEDLLDYSRMGHAPLEPSVVELDALVPGCVRRLGPALESSGGRIEVLGSLPAVTGNEVAIAQVLDNLLRNAIKFVAPGTVPHVEVHAEEREQAVRVWVDDNGIGVPEEHRERIFGVFDRLHGVETFPGTGIGLAIVRRAVGRMGGACGVAARPGGGSRFWIELPAAQVAAARGARREVRSQGQGGAV